MDPRKSMEDQFAKMHPCFPVNTRIGIVGAGSSGLSAAYALSQLGYNNVTVLEKHHTVGGMCESVDIEGRTYDLGGQVLAANSAPVIFHLAKETECELEELDTHKFALIESSTGKYEDMRVTDDYVSVINLTLKLQDEANETGRIGIHAVSDIASDHTPKFLQQHGFVSVPKSVAYGYTASGYGFVSDMPYAYIHEFTKTSMAGKIRRFKGGYTSMWKKLSQSLPVNVCCDVEVMKIQRNSDGIDVIMKDFNGLDKDLVFDKLIISGSLPFRNGRTYWSSSSSEVQSKEVLVMNEVEKELFSKVKTIDYYTTVMKINGLDHIQMGFYYFGEFMDDPATIGNPVAMQRFYADTNIFLFWSYGNSDDVKAAAVTNFATDVVKNMGGSVEKIILQRRFKYFPHVDSEAMKTGFYEKLERELQGLQNTYYVGGLMAFELTERNSSYAMALARKHFANDNPLPTFPYVKRLLPTLSCNETWNSRKLDDHPEIQFPDLQNLDGYLKFWAAHPTTENKTLYTWLNEKGEVVSQRSYKQLDANATQIASKLLTSQKPVIKPGDRVLLVHVPGLEFVDAFFGCLKAKVLPVPVLPPDPFQGSGQALLKIENICKACNAVAILSTFSYHVAVRSGAVKTLIMPLKRNERSSASWPKLPWLHTDSWVKNTKNYHQEPRTRELQRVLESDSCPEEVCFLQFTSGSTGDAKGVMITHGGLIHNLKLMKKRYGSTSKTVLISWLPQYHDMGLIGGLFTALVSGASAILFSPMTFIKNPLLWLQTMSKYKATHSAGPNFAFELVIRRLEAEKDKKKDYNLSSMVFLMVAAEPVRQKTLKRFIELTLPYGLLQKVIAPGYGLAENCVFVSCAFGEGKPIFVDWQGRICCGYARVDDPDVQIKIVDPETRVEHEEDGREGEIWISSPSAGVGYWGKQEQSLLTFGNSLANHPGKKFTRTGDLGRIIEGKLFITGRIKDLIIVGGRNIYASDVEKTVEASSDVLRPGCCAVIGVPEDVLLEKGIVVPESSDQVGLVAIVEVRDGKSVDKEVIDQIQTRVVEEHGVPLASVKIIQPRTISKTTSGKIRRFECLKQFTDGTLNLVINSGSKKKAFLRSFSTGTCKEGKTPRNLLSRPLPTLAQSGKKTKDEILEFLKKLVSEQTGIQAAKITATESLISYGIDSIGVVRAAQKLTDFLGVPVGAVDIFTATCIDDLAIFSEKLLMKSEPQSQTTLSDDLYEPMSSLGDHELEITTSRKLGIGFLQLLAIVYISALLILPAHLSTSLFLSSLSKITNLFGKSSYLSYCIPTILAPLAWMLYMFLTCASLSIFGKSFLQPNYTLNPEISIWSSDFVRWWTLYKAQEIAGKVLATHLRGTPFLNYWFEMLGARVGSSVLLDTIDITDPSLVLIGDGAVIAEGALIQSHEVKNGILSFQPVKIGHHSSVGPYAVLQKGTVVEAGSYVPPLQKTEKGKPIYKSPKAHKDGKEELCIEHTIYHFIGIYVVGFLSSLSASIIFFLYTHYSQAPPALRSIAFVSIAGAFHWAPAVLSALATIFSQTPDPNPVTFAASMASFYIAHGILLTILTSISSSLLPHHRRQIITSCHLRFAQLLSGTEAFCSYLRLLGSKIGRHCSVRAINPVADPQLLSIGNGVHLGDFSRIVTSYSSNSGITAGRIELGNNVVIGSQSVVLPDCVVEEDVVLGALSVAPVGCVLQRGGVYVGSLAPTMVKNMFHGLDDRIEEMDEKYKKIVCNLAANLAITTMKVKSRYFHRIGASGKGELKLFETLSALPGQHALFAAGKTFSVLIRHSNSLSADDDARLDARGAAIRILSGDNPAAPPLLDLTLKTGKAFYARTIADFATWLVCGLPAREAAVARSPHIRAAVWGSLRRADSYAGLHYYSNITRLLRFSDGREMYAKFKIRPVDEGIDEDAGKVEPIGVLPPETGAIPRDAGDDRPLLFLADDFRQRVSSPDGVQYVFQMQFRPVPDTAAEKDEALDCTKPWDETKFPYSDIGTITIDRSLTDEESEKLEFNPFLKTQEVDIIRATNCNQSASIDHGRSLIYEICQHLRNGAPLPSAWKAFLDQSDVKVDLAGCPMAAPSPMLTTKSNQPSITLTRRWYQTTWATFFQPLLQTFLPYFLLAIAIHPPLNYMMNMKQKEAWPLHYMLPIFLPCSGLLASMICVASKWVLVGKKRDGESVQIWSMGVFMDTTWQAIRTVAGEYFLEMATGSVLFGVVMKTMGAEMEWAGEVYVDSMGALLNPEMVEMERGGSVGKEALLFGHVYDGEGGKVKFGKVKIGEDGWVGSRAICMPGVAVEDGAGLGALSLAMKGEVVRSR